MSINYKNLGIAKRKKKPKKEYALDIPMYFIIRNYEQIFMILFF